MRETHPPVEVGPNQAIVLQPYGDVFFALAPVFEEALPEVTDATRNAVVIGC